jgi:hypothetical protein
MLEFKDCLWIIMSQGRFRQVPATFEMLLLLLPVSARNVPVAAAACQRARESDW